VARFLTDKNDGSGRFVPPEVVLSNKHNEANFDQLRQHADRWSFRDNNVPRGQEPALISQGSKSPPEIDAGKRSGRP